MFRSKKFVGPKPGAVQKQQTASPSSKKKAKQGPNQADDARKKTILRNFDLNPRYGPFVGIKRIDRWKRAEGLSLKPPAGVWDLLQDTTSDYSGVPKRDFPSVW